MATDTTPPSSPLHPTVDSPHPVQRLYPLTHAQTDARIGFQQPQSPHNSAIVDSRGPNGQSDTCNLPLACRASSFVDLLQCRSDGRIRLDANSVILLQPDIGVSAVNILTAPGPLTCDHVCVQLLVEQSFHAKVLAAVVRPYNADLI